MITFMNCLAYIVCIGENVNKIKRQQKKYMKTVTLKNNTVSEIRVLKTLRNKLNGRTKKKYL